MSRRRRKGGHHLRSASFGANAPWELHDAIRPRVTIRGRCRWAAPSCNRLPSEGTRPEQRLGHVVRTNPPRIGLRRCSRISAAGRAGPAFGGRCRSSSSSASHSQPQVASNAACVPSGSGRTRVSCEAQGLNQAGGRPGSSGEGVVSPFAGFERGGSTDPSGGTRPTHDACGEVRGRAAAAGVRECRSGYRAQAMM